MGTITSKTPHAATTTPATATKTAPTAEKEFPMTTTQTATVSTMSTAPTDNTKFAPTRGISPLAQEGLAAYQKAQKESKIVLVKFLYGDPAYASFDLNTLPEEVRKALEMLVPNKANKDGITRTTKSSILDQLADMFGTEIGSTVSLMDIFKRFRMGEGEMRVRIRNMIYDRRPEARLWISYNSASEQYTLVGIGATVPKGWSGVLPK